MLVADLTVTGSGNNSSKTWAPKAQRIPPRFRATDDRAPRLE